MQYDKLKIVKVGSARSTSDRYAKLRPLIEFGNDQKITWRPRAEANINPVGAS